ncbi:acetamidase/formamidase family protein [Halarchaeum nitratireducens]|uniref:Acetamidase n=1 Tax=Halarchaeum nitratireducens TaxID=489913 RepID=A0A830GDU7_9EURY|nr:acetamidase/formamidase family protein [Halarchaeum nitratireducens]GGN24390.1 acetamidase [Halarchaeum nitratireducens]
MTDANIDHQIERTDTNVRHDWSPDYDPIARVEPGDTVAFECRDSMDGQVTPKTTASDVANTTFDPVHPITGPVAVEGAEPGDAVAIEILDLEHEGWGYTAFWPEDRGLLPEEFDECGIHIWDLNGDVGQFVDSIGVPLDPFPGIVGLAPAESGRHSTIPPRATGGNLDVKHLTEGATLYLPVEVAGAMLSVGDCHAAQGDGEVCVNGIEAPMTATVRVDLVKDARFETPRFETTGPYAPAGRDGGTAYATTGVGDDLMVAAKDAISGMIDYLNSEYGLSRSNAYVLCSAAVDLKINEVVNAPNWVVSAYLPTSLFE